MSTSDNAYNFEYYRYTPSLGAAILFIVLFILITALHTWQMFRTRTWYFIPFVVGGIFEFVGYIGRALSSQETPNYTLGPYIIQALLLLVAPALLAASIYMELGRIILVTDGECHSFIRKRWLTKVFVCGDVFSFAVQGAGAGLMAGKTLSSLHNGEHIIIVGLVVQVLFFGFFMVTSVVFNLRMNKRPTARVLSGSVPWQRHLGALYCGSALILIRSIFRLIEYAQGNDGYLISHEWFLYVFDGCLMFGTMIMFAWVHPSEISAHIKQQEGAKIVRHGVKLEDYSVVCERSVC